jgi:hypothetical protein
MLVAAYSAPVGVNPACEKAKYLLSACKIINLDCLKLFGVKSFVRKTAHQHVRIAEAGMTTGKQMNFQDQLMKSLRQHSFDLRLQRKHKIYRTLDGLTFVTASTPLNRRAPHNALSILKASSSLAVSTRHIMSYRHSEIYRLTVEFPSA